ncbi:hypothetical protein SUGI_0126400 [Cryptomeria japonica]|nr:hypothetical protein SUGI_0126400 [Cryptomeria japonica]
MKMVLEPGEVSKRWLHKSSPQTRTKKLVGHYVGQEMIRRTLCRDKQSWQLKRLLLRKNRDVGIDEQAHKSNFEYLEELLDENHKIISSSTRPELEDERDVAVRGEIKITEELLSGRTNDHSDRGKESKQNTLQEEPMFERKNESAEETKEVVKTETSRGESFSWHLNGQQPKAVMDLEAELSKHTSNNKHAGATKSNHLDKGKVKGDETSGSKVNESENVSVRPHGAFILPWEEIIVMKVIKKNVGPKSARGLVMTTPLIIRFPDVLRHKLEALQCAFNTAIALQTYDSHFQGVYFVKRNQDRYVVVEFGHEFVISSLRDVSEEREDFSTFADDYLRALSILEKMDEAQNRHIAELCFKICLALQMQKKIPEALSYYQRALSICTSCMQTLTDKVETPKLEMASKYAQTSNGSARIQNNVERIESKEEDIKMFKGLMADLSEKVEDLKQMMTKPPLSEAMRFINDKTVFQFDLSGGNSKEANESSSFDHYKPAKDPLTKFYSYSLSEEEMFFKVEDVPLLVFVQSDKLWRRLVRSVCEQILAKLKS